MALTTNQIHKVMLYTGKEAQKIVGEILARGLDDNWKWPAHIGAKGYFKDKSGLWSAFDNETGDCWCEDFATEQLAKEWCEGKFEVSGS